jgi:hypothetical protein
MKNILLSLLPFLLKRASGADHIYRTLDMIKENIRDEVSAIIFKTLMGLVVTVTTIFSLVQLGQALVIFLNKYENGLYLEMATFLVIGAAGCYLLWILFRPQPRIIEKEQAASGVDIQHIFSKFTEGLTKGYESNMPAGIRADRNIQTDF